MGNTDFEVNFICVYDLRKFQDGSTHGRTTPNNIACCLNALALMNMQNIASTDINSDLVNDYFITRLISNNESDSDLSELTTTTYS